MTLLSERARAESALFVVTAAWGATFIFVKEALDEVSPAFFVATRFLVAALPFLPFALASAKKQGRIRGVPAKSLFMEVFELKFLWVGIALGAGYLLQTVGLVYTKASHSGFLTAQFVVLTPLLASFMLGERLKRRHLGALAAVMMGLYFLAVSEGASFDSGLLSYGNFLSLLCAVAFAFQIVLVNGLTHKLRAGADLLCFQQLLLCGLMALVGSLWAESDRFEANLVGMQSGAFILAFILCTVFASVLAYGLQNRLQPKTTATRAALIYIGEPIFAALFAWGVGGESFSQMEMLGFSLLFVGIFVGR